MKKLLATTAVLCALGIPTAANAALVDYDFSYSVSYNAIHGNAPGISTNLPTLDHLHLTPGVETSPTNFITITPASTCGSCSGTQDGATASGTITVTFTVTEVGVGTVANIVETGLYTADYSGHLACATASTTPSDCIVWSLPLLGESFSNGALFDAFFNNAEDWAITPTIQFEAFAAAVPAPIVGAGLPGLLMACGGLWAFAQRRRRERLSV